MESILGEAWVMVQANIEPALKTVSGFLEKTAATEAIIKTRADISQVVRSYDVVKQLARDAKPIITLGADGAPAMRVLDSYEAMIREARPVMTVTADTAPAMRQVEQLQATMRTATIGVLGGSAAAGSAAGASAAAEGEAAAAGSAAGGALGGTGMLSQLKGFAEILGVLEGVHGIISAAKDTQEFQTRLVDLNTGAGETVANLGLISKGLLKMSTDVGVSAVELEKGLYFIESDGIHGAQALTVLQAAAEGARTGLADMEDVSVGLMTVMRSYEIPASQAAKTTSALVEAVAHGGVRLTDFAQGMKTVAPIAAAFNVPLDQVLGAMSTITSITHNAAQGATGLRFLLNTLAAPSNTAAGAMSQIGLAADQVQRALHDQGLLGALKLIETHLGQTFPGDAVKANAVLHDIFGGTRGMSAGVELTNQHLVEMIANIGDITTKTNEAGDSVAGWSKMQKTLSYQVDVMRAGLVRFGIEAGTVVLPGVTLLLRGIIGLARGVSGTLGAAIGLVRPEWDALVKGFRASPGDDLGGGLLGWIGRVGERVHAVAADIKGAWSGVVGALSGNAPTGAPVGGVLGGAVRAAGTARSTWGAFTGALHGRATLSTQVGPDGTRAVLPPPTTGLAGLATQTGSALRDVGKNVYPAMTLFSAGFKGTLDPKGFDNWEGAAVRAGQLAKGAFDGVKRSISDVVGVTKGAIDWGLKHKTLMVDLAVGVGLVVGAIKAWELATKALAAVQLLLDAAMDANPIGLIVVGIGLLVGGLIYAYQKVGWFRDGIQTAFHFVEKVGSEVWSVLSDAIHAFTNGPLVWIKEEIGKFSDLFHEKSDQIREIWNFLWTAIKIEFEIYWTIFSTAFKLALETIGIVWHIAWDFIKNDFTLIWGVIRDTLGFFLDLLRNSIALFIDLVTGKWGKLWGDLKKLVGDAFGDIGKLFGDFAKNALTLLYDAGKDVIGGLIKGLTDGGKTVWNAIKDVASSIIDGVKHFFGIKSPSTVMAGLGGNIMAGLIKGILASGAGMGGILDKIFAGALKDPWGWLAGHLDVLGSLLDKVPALAAGLAKNAGVSALHGLEDLGGFLFDAGGILPPGASLAINKTGAAETTAVFTPTQWATLHALAAGPAPGATAPAAPTTWHFYLGDKEITDLVDVRVEHANNQTARTLRGGVKRR